MPKSQAFLYMALLFLSGVLASCSDQRKQLEDQAQAAVSVELGGLTDKCLDQVSGGIGSIALDWALTQKQQDSLLLRPVMPYIKKGLGKKTEQELQSLVNESKARYKFILSVLIENKDELAAAVGKKFKPAKSLIDFIIKYLGETTAKFG